MIKLLSYSFRRGCSKSLKEVGTHIDGYIVGSEHLTPVRFS